MLTTKFSPLQFGFFTALTISSLSAQNLLTNGSFADDPAVIANDSNSSGKLYNDFGYNKNAPINGWVANEPGNDKFDVALVSGIADASSGGVFGASGGPFTGFDADNRGVWVTASFGGNGGVSQVTNTKITEDVVYTLGLNWAYAGTVTGGFTYQIVDDLGNVLATQTITQATQDTSLDAATSISYTGQVSDAGRTIGVNIFASSGDNVFTIDNVSLTANYPVESFEETVRWVNVDTQLGVGGPVKKYWQHRYDQSLARSTSEVGVLFLGDSITDNMTTQLDSNPYVLNDSPSKSLYDATWTSEYAPANYAVSGQVPQNLRWQIANGIFGNTNKPKVITLMIGTNTLHQNATGSGSSPAALTDADNRLDTVAKIQATVRDLKAWSPDSTIILHSILPRNYVNNDPVSNTLVENVNSDLSTWASIEDNVTYLDLYSRFSDGNGGIDASLYVADQLHLSTTGYQAWFDQLKPVVDSLISVQSPDYIRNLDIPVQYSTTPAKPAYADDPTAGNVGFGWNQNDKTKTWTENFEETRGMAPSQEAEIVFLGDSVTMSWGRVGGRTAVFERGTAQWNAAGYDNYSAINAGMSGDQTQNLLWRIENGQMDNIGQPKLLVLMIGTNNRHLDVGDLVFNPDGAQSSEEIANGILKVVQKLQAMYPTTHILCHGFLRGANNTDPERIAAAGANTIVEDAFNKDTNPYLHYLDMNSVFIDPASANESYYGNLHAGDNIHPIAAGYQAWVDALQPYINKYVIASNDANTDRGVSSVDTAAWQTELNKGTAPEVSQTTAVNQNAGATVNLSAISGEATYEFLVKAEDLAQAAATLLSESGNSLQLEQNGNTGLIGLSAGGDHQFSPFHGTSVSTPYGDINHLVVRVHANEGFSHVFLNGELVGTLNQAYTFSNSAAELANVSASPIATAGQNAVLGFAAYNSLLSEEEIQRHHQAAFGYETSKVSFTAVPKDLQLYPRTPNSSAAISVPVTGTVLEAGYDSVVVKTFRNGVVYGSEVVTPLTYTNGEASFATSTSILPELAQYDVRIFLRNASQDTLVKAAQNIVAGDVYIVQGQSNAYARVWDGSAASALGPYLRSFGTNPIYAFGETAADEAFRAGYTEGDKNWHYAIADEDVDNADNDRIPGHVGQLGVALGAELIEQHNVPVAVLTGAHGGKQISFFQRNDADANDTQTNYGRLVWRAEQAGVKNAIRGLIFCQGENDEGIIHGRVAGSQTPENYNTLFGELYNDWQEDFTIAQHYAIQVRPRCYQWVVPSDTRVRNYQRLWADTHANLSAFSYNAIPGQHTDFCHYNYETGYKTMATQIATAIDRDLYGVTGTNNVDAPNPSTVAFGNAEKTSIIITMRNVNDTLIADAGVETYFQLETADGTFISTPVTAVSVNGNQLTLTLSSAAPANAVKLGFQSHKFEATGDYWVKNAKGVGMLTFSETIDAYVPNNNAIAAGDVIAVDLSTAGGSANGFNTINTSAGSLAAGTVVSKTDGQVRDGVSVSLSSVVGFNNDSFAGSWPGTAADPHYDVLADDICFGPGSISLSFAGLDTNLRYNVRVYNLLSGQDAVIQTTSVTDGLTTQQTIKNRGEIWNSATLEDAGLVFNGVAADNSGNLNVTVSSTGGWSVLNAVVLEAVTPSSAPVASDDTFSISEDASNGTVVGSVTASDGDNDPLTYQITAGNGSNLFAIDANGQITTTGALDFQTAPQHVLTVEVSDGTETATATITVNVTESQKLVAGDVIAIDLSAAGGSATNYNVINISGGSVAAGSVTNLNGQTRSDVSATLSSVVGFNNDGFAGNWPGTASDTYYETAADDICFAPGSISLSFAGLDDSLLYNVRVYNLLSGQDAVIQTTSVTDGLATQQTIKNRGEIWNSATLEDAGLVFNSVASNGGNLDVTVTSTGGWSVLNAVVLEVVASVQQSQFLTAGGGSESSEASSEGETTPVSDFDVKWKFDETTGSTVFDDKGNHDGTVQGLVTQGEVGIVGNSYLFSAGQGSVALTSPTNLSNSSFTLSTWVKTSATNAQTLFEQGDATSGVQLTVNAQGQLNFAYRSDASTVSNVTSTAAVNDGQWNMLTVSFDASTQTLTAYVNGQADGTTASIATISSEPSSTAQLASNLDGNLDEVAIYEKVLTAEEIQALYQQVSN